MMMMVVTVQILSVVTVLVMVTKPMKAVLMIVRHHLILVQIVNLISQLTDLNAAIPHGMSLVLTVLI